MGILLIIAERDVSQTLETALLAHPVMGMEHAALLSTIKFVPPGSAARLQAIVEQLRTIAKTQVASLVLANAIQIRRPPEQARSTILDHCLGKFRMTTIYMTACRTMSWP